jgi:hypothetical protein
MPWDPATIPPAAVAAAVALAAVLAGALAAARRRAYRRWIRTRGRPVSSNYQATQTVSRPRGGTAYRLVSSWRNPHSGIYYTFLSPPLAIDPTPYAEGRGITVRIDPRNPKRYWMDTSFLPEGASEPL